MFYNESSDSGIYESESFEPLPDNTILVACITSSKTVYDDKESEEIIELKWLVIEGEHAKRKLYQKIRINNTDPDKAGRANKMMMAIDFNCGKHLSRLGRYPTNDEMGAALIDKPMKIVTGVWEQGDKKGNWIKAVYGLNDDIQKPENKPADEPF